MPTTAYPTTFAECMDVFDWFNDEMHDYLDHVWRSKIDADARITRALPSIIERATALIEEHAETEAAYPDDSGELLNQPA